MRPILMWMLVAAGLAAVAAQAAEPPELAGFEQGRTVWIGTCALCHSEPATGAPQLGDAKAWAKRIAQGKAVLYGHALEGFMGPLGDEMPARGANPDLSDDDIKAAVDYMVEAATRNP
jgi:cytochrome c5